MIKQANICPLFVGNSIDAGTEPSTFTKASSLRKRERERERKRENPLLLDSTRKTGEFVFSADSEGIVPRRTIKIDARAEIKKLDQ